MILAVAETPTPSLDAIYRHLDHDRIGSTVSLRVLRNAAVISLDLKVVERPDPA